MKAFMLREVYCPNRRWWWPWHRWQYDGPLPEGVVNPGYMVLCRRCRQGRRVYDA